MCRSSLLKDESTHSTRTSQGIETMSRSRGNFAPSLSDVPVMSVAMRIFLGVKLRRGGTTDVRIDNVLVAGMIRRCIALRIASGLSRWDCAACSIGYSCHEAAARDE